METGGFYPREGDSMTHTEIATTDLAWFLSECKAFFAMCSLMEAWSGEIGYRRADLGHTGLVVAFGHTQFKNTNERMQGENAFSAVVANYQMRCVAMAQLIYKSIDEEEQTHDIR